MNERYSVIFLGNPYEFVVKDHYEPVTIGVFNDGEASVKELVKILNEQNELIEKLKDKNLQLDVELNNLKEELRLALN